MTVRTIVQGNGREVAVEAATGGSAANAPADGGDREAAWAAGERPRHRADDRCSPDPCQHTDRYRLVTPFSLRL
ncbi:MAG: hypothetical protein AB7O97_22245 [Planctomycetota bacterium]